MERVSRLNPGIREPISRELPALRNFVYDYLSPRAIRVAPYVTTASAVRFLIVGHNEACQSWQKARDLGDNNAETYIKKLCLKTI